MKQKTNVTPLPKKNLKQGKDENAVLSIGYADGLVDALRMAKGIEPKI